MAAAPQQAMPSAATLAADWSARLRRSAAAGMPFETEVAGSSAEPLAAFIACTLERGARIRVLVADDRDLPEFTAALDPLLRPLCLILPAAEFAAGTARRASLALLRSRLWRDGDDSRSGAWATVREHLRVLAGGEVAELPAASDETLSRIFPALITPRGDLVAATDGGITVLVDRDEPSGWRADHGPLLRLSSRQKQRTASAPATTQSTAALLYERARLTQDIADLELELASVQSELGEFSDAYQSRVGRLMSRLDILQADRAAERASAAPADPELRAAAAQAAHRAEESARESARHAASGDASPPSPAAELRRLFRRLARQIHPDRADDDVDRALRTRLMAEANLAYRCGDVECLSRIEAQWRQLHPEATGASDGAPRIEQQVQRLRNRLAEIESELQRIFGSPLYQLFIAARQASRTGRDLLVEMAAGLQRAIAELEGTDP